MGVIAGKRQVGSIGPVGVIRQQSSNQYQRIAAATDKLTQLAIGEMGRQAAISGEQLAQEENISKITTLDPITNKPEALSWVEDNSFLGRVGKEAYQETIAKRFQFEIDNQLKIKAKELAIKYQDKDGGVELFKDQMHQYIDSMATGSEATGYSNYIMQSGVALTTTTSLNLMDKAAARERAKTTSVIVTGLEDQLDALETLVSNGDLDRADIIRKDTIAKLKKIGIDARNYSKEQLDQIVKQFTTSPTGSPAPVNTFTNQTTAAAGYPVGYSASVGVIQGDLTAMKQGLYKENLLLDPSQQYVVRSTGQQIQQVKRKPFRRS